MLKTNQGAMFDIKNSGNVKLTNNTTTQDSLLKADNVGEVIAEGNIAGKQTQAPSKKREACLVEQARFIVGTVVCGVVTGGIVYWLGWH